MRREGFDLKGFDIISRLGAHDETVAILAVGDAEEWRRRGNAVPTEGSVAFASFKEVDGELLQRLSPSCVLSPALSNRFDCIDLALALQRHGYRGRYRAFSHELPRPELVEREIAQLCPELDFAILVSN